MDEDQDLLSSLTSEQLRCLQNFRDISQTDEIDRAIEVLARNNWHVQSAVDDFFRNSDRPGGSLGQPPTSSRASSGGRSNAGNAGAHPPAGILHYFQWLFQSTPTALRPDDDRRSFLNDFDRKYGADHPLFFSGSYAGAVTHAFQQSKFLLVYLHSPIHEDTDQFCRQVICSPAFRQYVDEHLIFWGGSIEHAEAYNLSYVLKAGTFPSFTLLLCQSERSVQLVDRVQGLRNDHDILQRLQTAVNAHSGSLQRISADWSYRNDSSTLIGQQDREYMESVEADRRLMAQREREMKEKEDAEEQERQKVELEKALELSRALDKQKRIEQFRKQLKHEPAAGNNIANIKFQLPNGKKLTRNFAKTDTVEDLRAYLSVYFADNEIDITEFSISTNYPKRVLDSGAESLDEAGLFPRGMLFVQNLET